MAKHQIKYKGGYKYQLTEECEAKVSVTPEQDIQTSYIDLTTKGLLTIKSGYAWDGPSGPTIDTPTFMRGSLVHDAMYQLMRNKAIDKKEWREKADRDLRRICLEDGMSRMRAWWVYKAVHYFGDKAASEESKREVKEAP